MDAVSAAGSRVGRVALGLMACLMGCVSEGAHAFRSDVVFDTVVSIGHPGETNPLFLYRLPVDAKLVDDTLVLFADSPGGYLTAVNPETGRGWEVWDRGESGPGHFGGARPWVSESGGRIYTALMSPQASVRSIEGELLSTHVYDEWSYHDRSRLGIVWPVGILAGGLAIVIERDPPDSELRERQTLGQGVVAYSYAQREWEFDDFPPWSTRLEFTSTGGWRTTETDGQIVADARHNTVAVTSNGAYWIAVLNADGTLRRRVATAWPVFSLFVDANERVWAHMWAQNDEDSGSYVVFDRNLNVVDSVIALSVQDASGDRILTLSKDEPSGVLLLNVLERRGR